MMMAILQKHFGCKSRKGNPKHQHPRCKDARNIQVVKMAGNVPCFQITIHSSRKHRNEDGSSRLGNSTTSKLTMNYEILCSYAKHTQVLIVLKEKQQRAVYHAIHICPILRHFRSKQSGKYAKPKS